MMSLLRSLLLLGLGLTGGSAAVAQGARYQCPPCGCASDAARFEAPGNCAGCAMPLVRAEDRLRVAVLVFNRIQLLDFTGPIDVFANQAGHFDVYTVGPTKEAVTATGGVRVVPNHSLADAPEPDVLVVPGGDVREVVKDPKVVDWVRRRAAKAQHVLSVCTGAFILEKAGLLDGLETTTYHSALGALREASGGRFKVHSDRRWVDNGKVVLSAGISSGIDAAFHVVAKILGEGEARRTALNLEYNWQPEATYARAALADLAFPAIDPFPQGRYQTLKTEGDRDRWTFVVRLLEGPSLSEAVAHLKGGLEKAGVASLQVREAGSETAFTWTQPQGAGAWSGSLKVRPEAPGALRLEAELRRRP